MSYSNLSALLEAIVYLAKEPVSLDAIHKVLPDVDRNEIQQKLNELMEQYRAAEHGIEMREVADGFRFSTKPEHHEKLKQFIKSQIPVTRLSLGAVENLAGIRNKKTGTGPANQDNRGVHATGGLKKPP